MKRSANTSTEWSKFTDSSFDFAEMEWRRVDQAPAQRRLVADLLIGLSLILLGS